MKGNEQKELLQCVRRIVEKEKFLGAKEKELLGYLAKNTISGENLKETTIAIDVFNRDDRYDPSEDSIVRSNMYSLRRKLNEYYTSEGKSDKVRISIPKGSYRVELERRTFYETHYKKIRGSIPWILLTISAFIAIILLWKYNMVKDELSTINQIDRDHVIWNSFFKSDAPVMIVLGDVFMIEKLNSDSSFSYLRDESINSNEQLKDAIVSSKIDEPWREGYGHPVIEKEMSDLSLRIFNLFRGTGIDIKVKVSSELNVEDVKTHNLIFVGGYNNLHILRHFIQESHYVFEDSISALIYKGHSAEEYNEIQMQVFNNFGIHNDYVLVSKRVGSHETEIVFILSKWAYGKNELIRLLSIPNSDALPEQLHTDSHWEMLYKVSGLENSGMSHELLYFDYLD